MKKVLLLGLPLAGAAVLIYVLFLSESPSGPATTERTARPAASAPDERPDAPARLVADAAPEGPERAAVEAPPEEPAVEPAAALEPIDEASAKWVEGRVVAELPLDEELWVLALERDVSASELYAEPERLLLALDGGVMGRRPRATGAVLAKRRVEPDGSFRLPFPGDRDAGWVALLGRYAWLPRALAVEPGSDEPVVLEPSIGGLIRGRVTLPPGAGTMEDQRSTDIELELDPTQFSMMRGRGNAFDREARLDAEGRFEIRAIDPATSYVLTIDPEGLATWTKDSIAVESGRAIDLDVRLVVGGTIAGTVRDATGAPIAEAGVRAAGRMFFGFPTNRLAESETDADGRFTLEHVAPGKVQVIARSEGFLENLGTSVEVGDGERRDVGELVLEAGSRIAGRITWPDGSPAAGAEVDVGFDPAGLAGMGAFNAARGASGEAEADADGRFEVQGLGKGPFLVQASAEHAGSGDEGTVQWRDKLAGITPGRLDLELVLAEPPIVDGIVSDAEGAPVTEFEVLARAESTSPFLPGASEKERFEDEEGRFRLTKLEPGTWTLEIRADGFGPSAPLELDLPLPPGGDPLSFVLTPASGVRGVVLDPAGNPASGATVTLLLEGTSRMAQMAGRMDVPETLSDETGAFVLDGLGEGSHRIIAKHADYAESEALPFEVGAGGSVEGVVLRLRQGGVLAGIVYGKEGEPASGVQLVVQDMSTFETEMRRAQADGTFRIENVRPGKWQVTAMLAAIDVSNMGEDDQMPAGFLENMRFSMVDVEDGEETWVELGKPPADPVHVTGRVTHGGQPVKGAFVSFLPEGAAGFQSMKIQTIGEDGAYAVDLDAPGEYLVSVQRTRSSSGFEQSNIEFSETIPAGEDHRLDLALPVGRISGRVAGPDGKPAINTRVSLVTDGGIAYGTFMGGNYAETTTNNEGVYAFEFLRPGTYCVAAGGAIMGGALGGDASAGREVRSGVRVSEGQSLGGVDFRLKDAGSLAGTVVDSGGKPVSGASIFVFDESGIPLERFSMITSASDGRFTVPGLAPGRYTVGARNSDGACVENTPVEIREEEESRIQLTIAPGTILLVTVIDENEAEIKARISVSDSHGRRLSGTIGFAELTSSLGQGFSSREQRLGPLPADTYTVVATAPDGRETKKTVTLSGQEERRLKVRLR